MTIIKSTTERFRRAGIEFTRHGVDIDLDKLAAKDRAAIEAEPRLVIESDDDAKGKTKAKDDGKAGEKAKTKAK